MKFSRFSVLLVLAAAALFLFGGCSVAEPDYRDQDYGYVQFKLYKEASYPGSKAIGNDPLEYLSDATKIKVTLGYGEDIIYQTLTFSSADAATAEFGIRSEKLKLLAGEYKLLAFILFDKKDAEVYEERHSAGSFKVVPDGLTVHDVVADTRERGSVRFSLVKDMSGFQDNPTVKAVSRPLSYTFDEIGFVDLVLYNKTANEELTFRKLPADFSIHFDESDDVEDGYQVSSIQCDTLLPLRAGHYVLTQYTTFSKAKKTLELNTAPSNCEFDIKDNQTTEVDVPISLVETDGYIQDYYALYEIWKALHGEEWYYIGENFQKGTNWDFNKDVDLWGDQPGVQLHSNGRVALIDISDFGFYGHMPDALGNLTQLVELYLGTHDDSNIYTYVPGGTYISNSSLAQRKSAAKDYLRRTHPVPQFSEPIARAMMEKGVSIPEIEMYKKYTEKEMIDPQNGSMLIRPMDTNPGTIVNGLESLPESIGNLKKLEKLSIANSKLASLPAAIAQLESCTDIELYNLPNMVEFPTVIAHMPAIEQVNLSCNPQWGEHYTDKYIRSKDGRNGTQSDYGLHELTHCDEANTGEDHEDSNGLYRAHKTLQMIYMNGCGLSEVTPNISNVKKLGLLSLSNNKIDNIHAFGSDIVMVQLYLDHNKLTSIPTDNGVFCGMDDVENISFSYNELELLPDIFTSQSKFIMKSVDFSNNKITGVENGKNYKGINVETLSLTNNPIEKYPVEFAKSESKIAYINLRGCKLKEIPKEALDLPKKSSDFLMSLDLSYNHLQELPVTFNAVNIPHLYGLELSYNEFSKFPYEALRPYGLTHLGIRGQRDKEGNRCLSEWPLNIAQHAGLRGFYIGSNNLGKIEDTISPLCYYLEVSDNPNLILDASSVCYEWANNMYYLICDDDQEIRGCDVMRP